MLAVVALAALWPAPAGAGLFDVRWRTVVASPPKTLKPREPAAPLASADGRTVWVGTSSGIHALDAATGARRWHRPTNDPVVGRAVVADLPTEGTAAAWGPTLYATTLGGALWAVDPATGTPRLGGPTDLDAQVHSALAADARHVYAFADPCVVLAIGRGTGLPVWRWSAGVDRDYVIEGSSGPLVHGSLVVAGTPTGRLVALAARDGALVWDATLELRDRSPYGDVDATPIAIAAPGGPLLVATSHSGGMVAVHPSDGRIVWRYSGEGFGQPVATSDGILVASAYGELHLVSARGERRLARRLVEPIAGAVGLWGHGLVLVPHEAGLDLVRLSDLRPLARLAAEHGFAAAPVRGGDVAVVVGNAGVAFGVAVRADGGLNADLR